MAVFAAVETAHPNMPATVDAVALAAIVALFQDHDETPLRLFVTHATGWKQVARESNETALCWFNMPCIVNMAGGHPPLRIPSADRFDRA